MHEVMTLILRRVLSSSENVRLGTGSYIDDISVDLSKVSCEKFVSVLEAFGLQSKPPKMINYCKILGLRVYKVGDAYHSGRDNKFPDISEVETHPELFSFCGRWIILVIFLNRCSWLVVCMVADTYLCAVPVMCSVILVR